MKVVPIDTRKKKPKDFSAVTSEEGFVGLTLLSGQGILVSLK